VWFSAFIMILLDDMTSQIAGDLFLNPQNPRGEMKSEKGWKERKNKR